jgi:hypothetical protein
MGVYSKTSGEINNGERVKYKPSPITALTSGFLQKNK